ncbi:hypothetical protein [Microvirga makkahensis]|uniref:Uncharacterized protein n=1 Tax=Microvirga makkahensis TaxID=1128670 RepID=A0A7X3MVK2_9HYPH|nr:hypothetical protein [Microvirga makkahensis]MXQ13935.1 hypothetical protein [Microvirga makkahensis]
MDQEVEYVARALYEAEDDALLWDAEPEFLKEEFRHYARIAIAMISQQESQGCKDEFSHAA